MHCFLNGQLLPASPSPTMTATTSCTSQFSPARSPDPHFALRARHNAACVHMNRHIINDTFVVVDSIPHSAPFRTTDCSSRAARHAPGYTQTPPECTPCTLLTP